MHFRGHATIWGNVGSTHYTPQFIQDETDPVKIEAFMKNYIQTTVARYKGQGLSWDVVNEAMDASSGTGVIRDSVYNKVDDYICKAFTWAREADPTALLFYNDFNHATVEGYWQKKADAVYEYLTALRNRGCPIDGVGFQLHENIDFDTRIANVKVNMQRYKDAGMIVHFTEVDIKCRKDSNGNCVEWTADLLQQQAKTYGDLLTACLEMSNCESFEMWGFTDKYTWHEAP